MSEVTRILTAIEQGDPSAAEQLLPLVYHELRQLAAHKLAQEKPGQTLQATALVHETCLRLVDAGQAGEGGRLEDELQAVGDGEGRQEGESSEVDFEGRKRFLPPCAPRLHIIPVPQRRKTG